MQATLDLADFKLVDFLEDSRCGLWGELVEFFGNCAKANDRGEGSHFALQVRTLVEAAAALAATPVEQFLGDKALAIYDQRGSRKSTVDRFSWQVRPPPTD